MQVIVPFRPMNLAASKHPIAFAIDACRPPYLVKRKLPFKS